jgi:HAD superfamily hydrolase (TIGR01509 family)
MALDAIIFDLDGTLVDSNAVHVEAWRRALERFGYRIGSDRIFTEVGKGGDKLVPHLLGEEADEKHGGGLRKAQPEEFGKIALAQGLKVFPGAVELLEALRGRKLKTVIATSSEKRQLELIEKGSGIQWHTLVDHVVTASDAKNSKPDPDLVAASVSKLGLSPAQCAMVGDTPYDAQSARMAGVVCLGVTCGGHSAQDLMQSGARAVWCDPADLLRQLDYVSHVASPGAAHLTFKMMENLMREALSAALEGMAGGEVPIGCVLARGDGLVIAHGFNQLNRTQNRTAHAEMVAFARAAGKMPPESRDLLLVSTLEPCVMCLGASMEAAVDTIVYALKAPADSGTARVSPPQSPESQMPRIVGGILEQESRKLFQQWLDRPGNNPEQIKFVKQLLKLTGS